MKQYKVSGIENKKSYSGSDVFKYQATVMEIGRAHVWTPVTAE